jgi:hypothetical protein
VLSFFIVWNFTLKKYRGSLPGFVYGLFLEAPQSLRADVEKSVLIVFEKAIKTIASTVKIIMVSAL